MTFREIEKITGAKLPPKAQHHRAWWSNNPDNNVMTKVWLAAGFESAQVDMEGRKLVFRRVAKACRADPRLRRAGPEAVCHERRPASDFWSVEGHHATCSRRRSHRAGFQNGRTCWTRNMDRK